MSRGTTRGLLIVVWFWPLATSWADYPPVVHMSELMAPSDEEYEMLAIREWERCHGRPCPIPAVLVQEIYYFPCPPDVPCGGPLHASFKGTYGSVHPMPYYIPNRLVAVPLDPMYHPDWQSARSRNAAPRSANRSTTRSGGRTRWVEVFPTRSQEAGDLPREAQASPSKSNSPTDSATSKTPARIAVPAVARAAKRKDPADDTLASIPQHAPTPAVSGPVVPLAVATNLEERQPPQNAAAGPIPR